MGALPDSGGDGQPERGHGGAARGDPDLRVLGQVADQVTWLSVAMRVPSLGLVRLWGLGFCLLVGRCSSPAPGDRVSPAHPGRGGVKGRPKAERALMSAQRPLTPERGRDGSPT
jgi:hypothetical protein